MMLWVVPLAAPVPHLRPLRPLRPLRVWMRAMATRLGMGGDEAGPQAVPPAVVERARAGDHLAFADIVRAHDHRLRGLAYRLLGDQDRMDDVLQEAYVRAFRALPRFKGDAALGTWLYRIVYNASIDELRRRPTGGPGTPLPYDDERLAAEPSTAPDPGQVAMQRRDLADALAGLPPDQRAVVMLVDAYGFDYGEAAEVLGVRSGTIASRLNRARGALRRVLGDAA